MAFPKSENCYTNIRNAMKVTDVLKVYINLLDIDEELDIKLQDFVRAFYDASLKLEAGDQQNGIVGDLIDMVDDVDYNYFVQFVVVNFSNSWLVETVHDNMLFRNITKETYEILKANNYKYKEDMTQLEKILKISNDSELDNLRKENKDLKEKLQVLKTIIYDNKPEVKKEEPRHIDSEDESSSSSEEEVQPEKPKKKPVKKWRDDSDDEPPSPKNKK
jgi:hypothetical protein